MQKTWVWSLGQEDPLEKEMATHSSILAWRIPWMEEFGGLQSTESQRVQSLAKSGFCFSLANVFNMYFVFKIRLGKEGCNWVLISSPAGWHTLHLPLWHSLILAHRLCKPAASLFVNFPDPKREIRVFYFTCNTRWWHGSLLYKAANSPGFLQEVRHQPYLGGFCHILYPSYFVLAWKVEDGDHGGHGSPAVCLLFPDLCSPVTWVLISLRWRKTWLAKFSCKLCSLCQHQWPLSYNLKNSVFILLSWTFRP